MYSALQTLYVTDCNFMFVSHIATALENKIYREENEDKMGASKSRRTHTYGDPRNSENSLEVRTSQFCDRPMEGYIRAPETA